MKDATEAVRAGFQGSSPNQQNGGASLGDTAIAAYDLTKSRASSIMAAARENRLSLCLIGAGLAWMMLSNSRTASELGAKASNRLSEGSETARDKLREAGQQMTEMAGEAGQRMSEMA